MNRRDFINYTASGLAVVGAGELIPADAAPTLPSGDLGAYGAYLRQEQPRLAQQQPQQPRPTEDNILGPFHRERAPYRAKITPPFEQGTVLLISGRVSGHDTRRPLPNTIIDIWQANAEGRYDNDDPRNQPAADVFVNRARLVTDENGYYEYETIHPGAYRIDRNTWRPPHIHYMVRHPQYRQLVTQLYFRGDEHQKGDQWIRDSLIIDLREQRVRNNTYKKGTFNIILAPNPRRKE